MGFERPVPDFISSPGASEARRAYAQKMGTYNPEDPPVKQKPAGPKEPSRADRLKAMEDMERRHAENRAAEDAQRQGSSQLEEDDIDPGDLAGPISTEKPDADAPTE